MQLTLVRHAVAVERGEWDGDDADRPLTHAGTQRASHVFKALRRVIRADEIWTSPWSRARATAELAATYWKLPLREMDWLAGDAASPSECTTHLHGDVDLVLVGHEPDLGDLIGYLIGGSAVPMSKAGIAILDGDPGAGGMTLRALYRAKAIETIIDA